ncbi:MAG: hypothetical protein H7318_19850 [Oligoflexus sp.]|nr:hypothetical protein [Oligoflexus sp.]
MLRIILSALFLILHLGFTSCKTLNNRTVQIQLDCGMDIPLKSFYSIIQGPDGHQLGRSEFEAVRLTGDREEQLPISQKGCFLKPESGKVLIRAKNGQWVKFYELGIDLLPDLIKLEDVSEQNLIIRCDQDETHSVSSDFELDKLFIHNIGEKLQSTLRLEIIVYDTSDKKTSLRAEILDLRQAKGFKPFASLKNDSRVILEIRLTDQLKKRTKDVMSCPFKLDSTPPEVQLTSGRAGNAKLIDLQGMQGITLIDPASNFEFISADSDAAQVAFCMTRLHDEANPQGHRLSDELLDADRKGSCSVTKFQSIALKSPIPFEERSGFWSIWFQGIDALGNKSAISQRTILFLDQNKLDSIRKTANYDPVNQLEAVIAALEAYLGLKKLSTEYEKHLVEAETFIAMKKVFDLRFIRIPLSGHSDVVQDIKFTPKEDHIVSTANSETKFWNYMNARKEHDRTSGSGVVEFQLLFNKQNKLLMISRYYTGNMLNAWNLDTLEWEPEIPLTGLSVISPSGEYLVSVQSPHKMDKVFPPRMSKGIGEGVKTRDIVLAFGRNDSEVFFQKETKEIELYNIESHQVIRRFEALADLVSIVDFSKDRSIIGVGTKGREIILWNIDDGVELDRFFLDGAVTLLKLSEDGKRLFAGSINGSLLSIEVKAQVPMLFHELSTRTSIGDISRDFTRFVATDLRRSDGASLFVKLTDPQQLTFKVFSFSGAAALEISPGAENISYASTEGQLFTWDQQGGKLLDIKTSNPPGTRQVQFSKDGNTIYGISGKTFWRKSIAPDSSIENLIDIDYDIAAFDITQDEKFAVLTSGYQISVFDIFSKILRKAHTAFADYGLVKWNREENGFIAASITKGAIVEWNAKTLSTTNILQRHDLRVLTMEMNSEKSLLASGSADGAIKIWDLKQNKLAHTLIANGWVTGLAFHPGGRFLISSTRNNVLTYWDIDSGKKVHEQSRPSINNIKFTANGKGVFFGSEGTSANFESLDIDYIYRNICESLKSYLPATLCSLKDSQR